MNIQQAGAALRAGKVSSRELTDECLRRIERANGELNAFLTVTAALAMEAAEKADRHERRGFEPPQYAIRSTLRVRVQTN